MLDRERQSSPSSQTGIRISTKVAAQLMSLLASDAYSSGDLLPPERTLAENLSVSRATLREALKELEARGLVSRTQGSGTRIMTPPEKAKELVEALQGPELRVREAMEVRLSIEPFISGLAAMRSTPVNVAQLAAALDRNRLASTPEEALESDIAFHLGLAQAARNPLLYEVDQLVTKWTRAVRGTYDTATSRTASYRGHAAILEHIRLHDREGASAAMAAHLSEIQSLILEP